MILDRASARRVAGRIPLLEIALASGYGSTEAFGRAFLADDGCTSTCELWLRVEPDRRA